MEKVPYLPIVEDITMDGDLLIAVNKIESEQV